MLYMQMTLYFDICYIIIMSSNKFLQRFEGKIKVVGKQGVHDVFGSKKEGVVVYTNTNFNQPPRHASSSISKSKQNIQASNPPQPQIKKSSRASDYKQKSQIKPSVPQPPKEKKVQQSPFLISNPFYLDEQDRLKQQQQRIQRVRAEKQQKERQKQALKQTQIDNQKGSTNYSSKSLQKKKNQRQWVKLGGLGANIGGQQWLQKKKKQDKMQQFASQVKSINKDKPKIPQPKKQPPKQPNARQKALQYSKNVPKLIIRTYQQQPQQIQQKIQQTQEKLTELQLYQLKHQQYKNLLQNQL